LENGGVERRLTTILAADIAGYSRLMAADEVGTLARITELRKELIEPKLAEYHGRTVKLMGDGALLEFSSVVNAVRFAIDVQQAMIQRNFGLPENQQILYRVGINTGDILVEGDDIFGDGVNIAARLETLAEPGGICVSAKVHDEVDGKLEAVFKDLGGVRVKNIPHPVHVYRVVTGAEQAGAAPAPVRRVIGAVRGWALAVTVGLVLGLLGGLAMGLISWDAWFGREGGELAAPDKPSIVVLPFASMSSEPDQEYFVDGMTEDLTTDLANISGLFVISRNSAFSYKGRSVEVLQVARELGVRYVLEGSARRIGEQVRINAQLIDTESGGHLWAERYDGKTTDIFALQDKVTASIVDALALELLPQERQRLAEAGTDNAAAHDAYLLGLSLYYRRTPEDNASAAGYFRQAIELDPDYAPPYTALAKVYVQAVIGEQAYADELEIFWTDGYEKAAALLERGMKEPNADFHVLRSWLALRKRQHRLALTEARLALELNPNDADAMEALSEALIYAGKTQEGSAYAERAMRQNPAYPGRPLYLLGLAEFAKGNPDETVQNLESAIRHSPDRKGEFAGLLAAAYGELGQGEKAAAAFTAYNDGFLDRPARAWTVYDEVFVNPRIHTWRRINLAWAVYSHPFERREVLERLANGFRRAGVSEGIGGYLPLGVENRLTGAEIRSTLFGAEIRGSSYWLKDSVWRQRRTAAGAVRHSGYPIHPGLREDAMGSGKLEDDLLCEQWPALVEAFEICVAIFRVPDRKAQIRWGDYVMVTDTGPHPFSLAE
jgi:TolB-like protein/class 3 adenylate cyclase